MILGKLYDLNFMFNIQAKVNRNLLQGKVLSSDFDKVKDQPCILR